MVRLSYLTPFAFLALLPLGGCLGGAWTFAAAAATALCIPGLEFAFGNDEPRKSPTAGLTKWLPRIYILAQLSLTAWVALIVSRGETSLFETAGLAASAGLTTGVFGFVAAHEMVHSSDDRIRSLGLVLLATTFYMHFGIAHLAGHHRWAATDEDPTSARLGEGLYPFICRSVAGQIREAWIFEVERLRGAGRSSLGLRNRMSIYLATEVTLLVALAFWSWRAMFLVVAVAAIAVTLLETFNYVAHYGLRRRVGPDGRIEPLTPDHSWNSKTVMDRAALFNAGCHSDHHCHPSRSFEELEPVPGRAILPFGYGTALLTALVPPIWRKIMDERAPAAMAKGHP
jgi:alkane 1-monooxygenase